ncbi:hypothetical protein ACIA8C_09980 [Nocardia sp. NPDC051321]
MTLQRSPARQPIELGETADMTSTRGIEGVNVCTTPRILWDYVITKY